MSKHSCHNMIGDVIWSFAYEMRLRFEDEDEKLNGTRPNDSFKKTVSSSNRLTANEDEDDNNNQCN